MILQLRDDDKRVVADIELWVNTEGDLELKTFVPVRAFALKMLELPSGVAADFVSDIESVQDLTKWVWQEYEKGNISGTAEERYSKVLPQLIFRLREIGMKYGLEYAED